MEPRIQYAQTNDGVNIAFYTLGEGMPVVTMPSMPFGHLQLEWQIPEYREWCQSMARTRRLVRYDSRGHGLSDRDVTEYSLDGWLLDLEAVVDSLGLERFALFAPQHSGPVGIAYAARHPERVSHLLLWFAYARSSDYMQSPQLQTLRSMITGDWETYTETVAHTVLGWSAGEAVRRFAALMREGVTPEAAQAIFGAASRFDVAALLPQISVPTLVLHRRQYRPMNVDVAKGLASRIPHAQLALLEGSSAAMFLDDTQAVAVAIDEFLGEGEEAKAKSEGLSADIVHTILFTDVEGSTALTERLGDARARELLREHEGIVREALKAHGGSEVKTMGDGFMTSFSSATRALECAIAIQIAFDERNRSLPAHPEALEGRAEPIKVRIGLNAGEPIAEDDDLYGTAVNLAARIAAQAEGGEILASEAVRQIVAGKKFPFSDRGETTLRGFEDRVHIYQVSWREGND